MDSSSQGLPSKKRKHGSIRSFFQPIKDRNVEEEQGNPRSGAQPFSEVEVEQEDFPQTLRQPSFGIQVERDPGKRKKISEWPLELRDEVRRKYLTLTRYRPNLLYYKPRVYLNNVGRRFNSKWYDEFCWLEYSPTTHKAYCFPCFLFGGSDKSTSALVDEGFDNWKRVHQGKECVFLIHVGTSSSSSHNMSVAACVDLMRPASHIDKVIDKISREEVLKHRLRLKASAAVVHRLALQGGAFRGHDESNTSLNRGNFIEWVNFLSQWNDEVKKVVLENAPGNAKYVSPLIQKELLAIMGNKVRKKIREEVGDACFAILVDEAQDESGHEQMAIILRFVNSKGHKIFFNNYEMKDGRL
ncbi:hypothetical protein LINGRAHAP2_LOCUS20051 [Linum grandiflorum]